MYPSDPSTTDTYGPASGSRNASAIVICDLGGVLVSLRSRSAIPGFGEYIELVEQAQRNSGREDLRFELQCGSVSFDDYVQLLRAVEPACSAGEVRDLENSLLAGLMTERIEFLRNLRDSSQARWVVLSNTHSLHWACISSEPALASLFDASYLSYDIGALKPDARAFYHVLRHEGVESDQCFFLDDNAENLETARGLRIRAAQVDYTEAWRQPLTMWLTSFAALQTRGR